MKEFDEHQIVFTAHIAVPKDVKPSLHDIYRALHNRLLTVGHDKFLVGRTNISVAEKKDD